MALVAFEMKEFLGEQKTEQDIQDKDSRIYRITARILDFHLISDKSLFILGENALAPPQHLVWDFPQTGVDITCETTLDLSSRNVLRLPRLSGEVHL